MINNIDIPEEDDMNFDVEKNDNDEIIEDRIVISRKNSKSDKNVLNSFQFELLKSTCPIQIQINPTQSFEERKLEELGKKIPVVLKNLIIETQGDRYPNKKDFIKNRYKNFLENYENKN